MNSVAVKINVKQISKSLFIKFVFHKGMDATILDLTCQPSVFSLVLSCHNKDLERRTLKPLAHHSSRVLDKLCYNSQTNQCYSSILFRRQQENPSLKRQSMSTQRQEKKRMEECASARERERENEKERTHTGGRERERKHFGSSFYMFFSSPWACRIQIGFSQECCLFYLRASLWSSDLPLTFLCSIFTGFSFLIFQPPPFWTPISYSNYLTLYLLQN